MHLSTLPVYPVIPINFQTDLYLILDFTATNPDLDLRKKPALDLTDTAAFNEYVFDKIRAAGAVVGVGGYLEPRVIYRRSPHFQQAEEPRTVHLGIDLWAPAGTGVFAPLAGAIHSFADNVGFGDYGPTIILEHELEGEKLFSLYGHLSRASLLGLEVGKPIDAGTKIAEIGPFPENGDWPPHLHFQLMRDMLGRFGDFAGVCAPSAQDEFAKLCPDPNLLLRIGGL